MKNTLAYYDIEIITTVKGFFITGPRVNNYNTLPIDGKLVCLSLLDTLSYSKFRKRDRSLP
jgi:hypothetical protein